MSKTTITTTSISQRLDMSRTGEGVEHKDLWRWYALQSGDNCDCYNNEDCYYYYYYYYFFFFFCNVAKKGLEWAASEYY